MPAEPDDPRHFTVFSMALFERPTASCIMRKNQTKIKSHDLMVNLNSIIPRFFCLVNSKNEFFRFLNFIFAFQLSINTIYSISLHNLFHKKRRSMHPPFQLVEKVSFFKGESPPIPPAPLSPEGGKGGRIRGADAPCDLSRVAPPPEPPHSLKTSNSGFIYRQKRRSMHPPFCEFFQYMV